MSTLTLKHHRETYHSLIKNLITNLGFFNQALSPEVMAKLPHPKTPLVRDDLARIYTSYDAVCTLYQHFLERLAEVEMMEKQYYGRFVEKVALQIEGATVWDKTSVRGFEVARKDFEHWAKELERVNGQWGTLWPSMQQLYGDMRPYLVGRKSKGWAEEEEEDWETGLDIDWFRCTLKDPDFEL